MNRLIALVLAFTLGLCPASAQFVQSPPFGAGQIPGTITNDNATAGKVGEYVSASNTDTGVQASSSTVTITIATPGVVTWGTTIPFSGPDANGHGTCAVVNFTTTGALPTGLVAGTNYYAIGSSVSGNTFQVATTCDNAIAGTAINTSGSQSGVQTGVATAILSTGTSVDLAGMSLTAGDWDISSDGSFLTASGTSVTVLTVSTSTTSATPSAIPGRQSRFVTAAEIPGVASFMLHAGPARFNLSATTTVYCPVNQVFTLQALSAYGGCRARRVR